MPTHGHSRARKSHMYFRRRDTADARAEDFTSQERQWLEEVMPVLIRRAAEVAYDPNRTLPEITMANLPTLSG